jgi:hypothetical protein
MPRKKRTVQKSDKQKIDGETTVHIQARLNPRLVREHDAYEVYADLALKAKKDDRWIVREALIAYGEMTDKGWKPQEIVDSITLSAKAVRAVEQLSQLAPVMADFQQLVRQLLTLDLSSLRYADGSPADGPLMARQLTQFEQSAKDVLGQAHMFEVDE